MKYLVKTTETYRVNTVAEVEQLHQALREEKHSTLSAFNYKTKYIKEKGEIIEEYQLVVATRIFNDEKEPINDIQISYGEN